MIAPTQRISKLHGKVQRFGTPDLNERALLDEFFQQLHFDLAIWNAGIENHDTHIQ
jgi:hypothetical protein